MGVFQAHVPEAQLSGEAAGPSEPAKPATVTGTSWPWNSPFAWAMPPPRRKPHRRRLARKRRPPEYETRCAGGIWFGVSLRGGPLLEASTEAELHALIAAGRGAR